MRIGLREANQHFSRVIRAVRAGTEVLLTDRGRPVAVIKPIRQANSDEDALQRLAAAGLLRPATKRGPMPFHRPVPLQGPPITQTLREDRDED